MKLDLALGIAIYARETLVPHCDPGRCVIAGSIRRRKPDVHDIEIVCVPKHIPSGLFGDESVVSPGFITAVNAWKKLKGEPTGRYTKRLLPDLEERDGIPIDLFIANPDNWGLILAIRTGSADYSHKVLARAWCAAGYHSLDGHLCTRAHRIPVREEHDLFDLIHVPWIAPEARNI